MICRTKMVAAREISQIEDAIRVTSQTRRKRPSEFFLDYDRLRTGYVTGLTYYKYQNLMFDFK